jgi:hypothetical protein
MKPRLKAIYNALEGFAALFWVLGGGSVVLFVLVKEAPGTRELERRNGWSEGWSAWIALVFVAITTLVWALVWFLSRRSTRGSQHPTRDGRPLDFEDHYLRPVVFPNRRARGRHP